MNREWALACIVALGCHALLLFGFQMETAATPLPTADSAVDVDLIAAVPAPIAPEVPPPPPELPSTPVPPQAPIPERVPTPEPTPVIETKPPPREPVVHHEALKPARSSAPEPKPTASAIPRNSTATAGGASSPVRPRSNPKPPYPPEARRLGQQGRVLLEVQVGADGRVLHVSVKRSSGFPALDSAALQGVERWTFEPARVAGLPAASRADVPVTFSLAQ